jgi:hypothetical protein
VRSARFSVEVCCAAITTQAMTVLPTEARWAFDFGHVTVHHRILA